MHTVELRIDTGTYSSRVGRVQVSRAMLESLARHLDTVTVLVLPVAEEEL